MTIEIVTRSGRTYQVANIAESFRLLMNQIHMGGFVIFNDVAISTLEIEAIREVK